MIRNLVRHRSLIWGLVKRELRGRYAGSVLGTSWVVLAPALTILVFFFVFSKVMALRVGAQGGGRDYVAFLCTGILPWNALHEAIQRSTTAFVDHANLLKRILFPKEILIAQIVLTTGASLACSLLLLTVVMALLGYAPRLAWLVLPVLVALQIAFSFGLGLIFATLNVFFRDLGQVAGLLFHLWFWMTPIVYPAAIVPGWLAPWLKLNPLAHLMDMYRDLLLHGRLPAASTLLGFGAVCAAAIFIGKALFVRFEADIVDEV